MYIDIKINSDDDAMVGSEGWGEYDARESCANFRQLVADKVAAAYSGHDVTVAMEQRHDTVITGDIDDGDAEYIHNIISNIWQNWEWLVR